MRSSPLGISKTKLSQLENDQGFIDRSVEDLVHYLTDKQVEAALKDKQPVGDYVETPTLNDYAKKADLDPYAKTEDLTPYAKTEDLKPYAKTEDLKPYVQRTELEPYAQKTDLDPYAQKTDLESYAQKTDLNAYTTTEDLVKDYVKKSETMTTEEIKAELGKLIRVEFADSTTGVTEEKVIYFIPNNKDTNDVYDEYMLIKGKVELIGTTKIDLSGYAKEEYVQTYVGEQGFAKEAELSAVAKTGSSTDLIDSETIVRKDFLEEQFGKKGNSNLKRFANIEIPAGNWTKDNSAPLPEYSFRTDIPLEGITEKDWKIIDFYTTEYFTGKMGPIVAVFDNKISFWSTEVINHVITIETIDLISMSEGEAVVPPPPPEYTYTVMAGATNGQASVDKPAYKGNEIAKVTLLPNDDYKLDYLVVDDGEQRRDVSSPVSIPIENQNHTLQVFFVRNVYKVSVTVNNGTATPNKEQYYGDETASIEFIPHEGYALDYLTVDSSRQTGVQSPLSVPINKQNHTVDIHFEKVYSVETIVHNGTINTNKPKYKGDETAQIEFNPNPQYALDYVIVDDGVQQKNVHSPMSLPINNRDHKVEVFFKLNEFTVYFDANGGSVSPMSRRVTNGNMIGELPTPVRSGYRFLGWFTNRIDGVQITNQTRIYNEQTIYAHWVKPIDINSLRQGELVKMGTLYRDGKKEGLPDGLHPANTSMPKADKINFEIRNTEQGSELQWRYATVDGKKLLVCDRYIARGMSWATLDKANLVFGKTITIDGQRYKIRCLTGGSEPANPNGSGDGGAKDKNEWDQIITNGIGIADNSNETWHWKGVCTICQDTRIIYEYNFRVLRGETSASGWNTMAIDDTHFSNCFRPVLEVIE